MRVVSLTCSNTEIVCALGCSDLLVGVDNHSDYPQEVVRELPRVGPDLGIDVRRVAALKPDLVLASLTVPGHERIVEALMREKLPFIAPEPCFLSDVYDDIELIAEKLSAGSRGRELVASMRREIDSQRATYRPRILVEWWPKPVIVPGKKSWVTDLIFAAGGQNPLAERELKSTPVTDDEARELAPEAVVISWCGVRTEKYRKDVVTRRSAWSEIPAVQNSRIYPVAEAYLGRPGPRLVEGYRALRQIVQSFVA